ncbi:MAG: flagellar basal body P-ring formation protein FlgA [Deltaproteobacteria bacterium]|nr:flagellar basal body P-ring formation protein FlgA [Deltaproteobacteria bacterium]
MKAMGIYLKAIAVFAASLMAPLMIASLVLAESEDGRTIRIEGRKNAIVNTGVIKLSDLAEVSSPHIADDETVIALKKLEIDSSPAPGDELTIPAARVLERMQEHGVKLSDLIYVLPRIITVKRAARQLSAAEVEQAIKDYFAASGRDVMVKSTDYKGSAWVAPNVTKLDLTPFNTPRAHEIGFTIAPQSAEGGDARFTIKAVIDEWLEIPVAKRPLTRGAEVSQDDFIMARLNLSALPNDAAREGEEVVGLETSSDIAPGEIFRRSKLVVPPVVSQGSKVTLLYKRGPLEASATGIALENGAMGDQIRVRNDASKKIISGKVLSAGVIGVNQ